MSTKGYGSYRGRSPLKRFLKTLAVIVVILALLIIGAALYLQQYLVVTDDGVRLDLPFLSQAEPSPSPSPEVTPTPPVLEVVTPTPEPELEPLIPVAMPNEALYDGSVLSRVQNAGGDCALFEMKTTQGVFKYTSQIPLIANTQLNTTDPALNTAIRAMNETEDLYTVAMIPCFKDSSVSYCNYTFPILTNSGYYWTDPDNIIWISPTNPDVQTYVTEICVELAELGFDEILLDYAGYPSEGNLHYIRKGSAYDSTQFSTVITGFYSQVSAALSEYDVKLSVVTTQSALDGTDVLTGQTPDNLTLVDRLWIKSETGTLAPLEKTP